MKTKKLLSLLSAGILAVSAVPMGANAEFVMGDVNQDGVFNNLDIDIIWDFFMNHDSTEEDDAFFKKYADANNDGFVNNEDIRLITKMYTDYDAEAQMGDINHDGYVDCVDATMILVYYADLSTNNYDAYTEEEHANFKMYGNVYEDENGFIDAVDATAIMAFYVGNSTELIVKPNK
ncbi:MAG: hypothetical protein K2I80_01980 [Ruminococcus sp.]|nr:hypothetical protein [Ruminococcus sp.]MDE6848236.1 hypothetical protein [Ruminococcus sp.]